MNENTLILPFTNKALNQGQLVVIGARPQMCRTLYALQIIKDFKAENAEAEKPWCFFIRTPESYVYQRLSNEEMSHVNIGFINEYREPKKFLDGIKRIANDKPTFIMLNRLELLVPEFSRESCGLLLHSNYLIHELSEIAIEYQLPVIVTVRLHWTSENNFSQRPMLKDFQSTIIESYAHQILALHRPAYYGYQEDESGNDVTNRVEIIDLKGNTFSERAGTLLFDDVNIRLLPDDFVSKRVLKIVHSKYEGQRGEGLLD